MMEEVYPIMLRLGRQRVVVVGGGSIAARKVNGLLQGGAQSVTVIAPQLCEKLQQLADKGSICWQAKRYEKSLLESAGLVFAATDDRRLNEQISNDALNCDILVCNVSDGEQGSFITPAVARSNELTVAISSGGSSPALVKHMKRELEHNYLPHYDQAQQLLKRLRADVLRTDMNARQRQHLLSLAVSEAVEAAEQPYETWYASLYNRTVQVEGEDAENERENN